MDSVQQNPYPVTAIIDRICSGYNEFIARASALMSLGRCLVYCDCNKHTYTTVE